MDVLLGGRGEGDSPVASAWRGIKEECGWTGPRSLAGPRDGRGVGSGMYNCLSREAKPERGHTTLEVFLATPRGFCAGVVRAIDIVELALEKYGPPVYVKHEIVHNPYVVESLEAKGAITVEDVDEVPEDAVVVFSAHGSPPEDFERAQEKGHRVIDATCPLVTKVHNEARKYAKEGRKVVLIGHPGHQEVIGTMGQTPMELIDEREEINLPEWEGESPWFANSDNPIGDGHVQGSE